MVCWGITACIFQKEITHQQTPHIYPMLAHCYGVGPALIKHVLAGLGILYRAIIDPFRNLYTAIILSFLGQYWHGKYNQIAACMYSRYLGQYGASTGPDMVTSTGPYMALCANCMETTLGQNGSSSGILV